MTPNGWESNAMVILWSISSSIADGWRMLRNKIVNNFYDLWPESQRQMVSPLFSWHLYIKKIVFNWISLKLKTYYYASTPHVQHLYPSIPENFISKTPSRGTAHRLSTVTVTEWISVMFFQSCWDCWQSKHRMIAEEVRKSKFEKN